MNSIKKSKQIPCPKRDKTTGPGIPQLARKVLAAIRYEKSSEVVPVRLPISLKNYIKQAAGNQGVSAWIRTVILEKLQHMTGEA